MTSIITLPPGYILRGKFYEYEIKKVLGQGSFGITYLASMKIPGPLGHVNTDVAIKEFFMKVLNGRAGDSVTCDGDTTLFTLYRKDFAREALNLARLQHSNIVKVLESFECNQTSYYVMEYINGINLDDYIEAEEGMSEYDALLCVSNIAKTVSFMHDNKMLHLDIKPKNIMRRYDGSLCLIDFGLSKQFNNDGEPESSTRIGGGTMGYAPLEQFCYKRGNGFPATLDVYALGGTLYKCITALSPPKAQDVLNEGLPVNNLKNCGASDGTIQLIERSMKPVWRERIQSVNDMIVEINAILNTANKTKSSNPKSQNVNWKEYSEPARQDGPTEPLKSNNGFSKTKTYTDADNFKETVLRQLNLIWTRTVKYAIDANIRKIISNFIQSMKSTSNGCLVGLITTDLYRSLYPKCTEGKNEMNIYDTMMFINKLQDFTGLHWRIPNKQELLDSFGKVSRVPFANKKKYLYFDFEDVSFHLLKLKVFGVETEAIDSTMGEAYYFDKYKCTIVLDPQKAEIFQTIEMGRAGIYQYDDVKKRIMTDTICIVSEKGNWYYGMCAVKDYPFAEKSGKWILIDKYGNRIDTGGIEFNEEPEIGFMDYPRPGPIILKELLRIKYVKNDRIGYLEALPRKENEPIKTVFEIERSRKEWKDAEYWT